MFSTDDLTNPRDVIERTPQGRETLELASRLGLVHSQHLQHSSQRPAFPKTLSNLGPRELSDLLAAWTSELGRLMELSGLLTAQERRLSVIRKRERSRAKTRVRANAKASTERLTVSEIDDLAEDDVAYQTATEAAEFVGELSVMVSATRDATTAYITTMSREITYRSAQMSARLM